MSIDKQPSSEQLYPVKAIIVRPNFMEMIRPNDQYSLAYGGEVPRVGEAAVRSLLQETHHFPSMSIVGPLGIEEGVHGYLFRPAANQRLARDFTWKVEGAEALRERIEASPGEFDPIATHFMLESINRFTRARRKRGSS